MKILPRSVLNYMKDHYTMTANFNVLHIICTVQMNFLNYNRLMNTFFYFVFQPFVAEFDGLLNLVEIVFA
jgi:hypothetical protein